MIYIVNGAPGSGKTTFEQICASFSKFGVVKFISTIDFVKEIAKLCGWDGTKRFEDRKFLSDLKMLLTQWNNVPYKKTVSAIEIAIEEYEELGLEPKDYVIFVDCREPKEITKLKVALGAKTILVRRAAAESQEVSNVADAEVLDYDYDIVIDNNGSLEELRQTTKEFLISEGINEKDL